MSVLDGPGEGTWSMFAMKVVEERDELRYKLAGGAAHIKSLEGLLVDAVRERDEARDVVNRCADALRRHVPEMSTRGGPCLPGEVDHALSSLAHFRDEARSERDEARRDLGEILAVIHRDGGHHTGEHGISKSVADAHATWAAVMRQLDDVASRARRACQVLVAEIGADGPADVDAAAERTAAEIRDLRDQVDDLRAAQEESEHQMHLRIRSGYDKTIADSWRAKVAEVEAERDELKARLAHAEAEAEQAIHNEAFSERQRIVAWIRAKHLMLSSLAIANCIEQGEHEE